MNIKEWHQTFRSLHNNEKGEIPVGPIVIIALIVIPLVILLINFKDTIFGWFGQSTAALSNTAGGTEGF